MKIRMLRPTYGDEGRLPRGHEADVDEARGKELIRLGTAEAVGGRKADAPPDNKDEGAAPQNKAETPAKTRGRRKG